MILMEGILPSRLDCLYVFGPPFFGQYQSAIGSFLRCVWTFVEGLSRSVKNEIHYRILYVIQRFLWSFRVYLGNWGSSGPILLMCSCLAALAMVVALFSISYLLAERCCRER